MKTRHGVALGTLTLAVATAATSTTAIADDAETTLDPVVVTAPRMSEPHAVFTDPRQVRLPLPTHDGGSYLKSIPGFSVTRKGGTSGDPELRGQGGSRLRMQLDGTELLGACPGRMDPPTAYVYPESYDSIEIIKGPQSVRHGAATAGVVRFERDTPRFTEADTRGYASYTSGSFGRTDLMADVATGDRLGYVRLIGTLSAQDDYEDGDGDEVHSRYERWSGTAILGWTPDERTEVEFTHDRSDGEAAYDDRGRDGTKFDRRGYKLSFTRRDLTDALREIDATLFHNHIEHWMDTFRLSEEPITDDTDTRTMTPERKTSGGRLTTEWLPADHLWLTTGLDYAENEHRRRMDFGMPLNDTAEFRDYGLFTELDIFASANDEVSTGLRMDRSKVDSLDDWRAYRKGESDSNSLYSGFLRYTRHLETRPMSLYVGIGRAERAPDFWERENVFDLDPEVLTQIDLGLMYATERTESSIALFYGEFDDFILIGGEDGAGNVDATHYGAEADLMIRLATAWSATATVSWVRADNDTDDEPLAQTPPPEVTLGLDYDNGRGFAGMLARGVARQDRIHEGFGTIYSVDTQETSGFGLLSVYGGYRMTHQLTVTAGVDNVFDRTYAEHLQRGLADLGTREEQINEPGRTFWLNLATRF